MIRTYVLELACKGSMACMKRFQICRSVDQNNDHAALIFFHQLIQFILHGVSQSGCMLNDQILSSQFVCNGTDASLI